jgi:hypothetical protein
MARRRHALAALALLLPGCCSPYYLGIEAYDGYGGRWNFAQQAYATAYDLGTIIQLWPLPFLIVFGVEAGAGKAFNDPRAERGGQLGWNVTTTIALPVAGAFMVGVGTLLLIPFGLAAATEPDPAPPPQERGDIAPVGS